MNSPRIYEEEYANEIVIDINDIGQNLYKESKNREIELEDVFTINIDSDGLFYEDSIDRVSYKQKEDMVEETLMSRLYRIFTNIIFIHKK